MTGSTISAAARRNSCWGFPSLGSEQRSQLPAAGSGGRILSVDPGKQLTGTTMAAFTSYVLVPEERPATRLLMKAVMQTNRWTAVGLSVGDLVMLGGNCST